MPTLVSRPRVEALSRNGPQRTSGIANQAQEVSQIAPSFLPCGVARHGLVPTEVAIGEIAEPDQQRDEEDGQQVIEELQAVHRGAHAIADRVVR